MEPFHDSPIKQLIFNGSVLTAPILGYDYEEPTFAKTPLSSIKNNQWRNWASLKYSNQFMSESS